MNELFSKRRVVDFHNIYVDYSERLAYKWNTDIEQSEKHESFNIFPDLTALFLDIIGKASIGQDFTALDGKSNDFLDALKYIEYQSTQPTTTIYILVEISPFAVQSKASSSL